MIIFLHTPVQVRLVCVDGGPPPLLWLWDLLIYPIFCFRSRRRRRRRKRTDARQVYVSCAQWCLSPLHLYGLWLCVVCCFFCECPSDWLSVTPEREEKKEEEEPNLSHSSHLLLLLLLTVFFIPSVYYFGKFQLPPLHLVVIFLVCEIYFWNRQTKKESFFFFFLNPFSTLCRCRVNLETRQISSAKKESFWIISLDVWRRGANSDTQPIRSLQSICVRVRHWLEPRASVVVSHLTLFPYSDVTID